MARVYFPATPDEIEATGSKFFRKNKAEGEKSPLKGLTDYDFITLGDKDFTEWSSLNQEAKDLDKRASQIRERRDVIWKEKLKMPMQRGKDVIVSLSAGNPTVATDWGFPTTKTVKKVVKKTAVPVAPSDSGNGGSGDVVPPAT